MLRIRSVAVALLLAAACTPPATNTQSDHDNTGISLVVTAPVASSRVTSPLRVEGSAPGDWFFEAVFPLQLRSPDGELIAEAPARAQTQWMTERPVPFIGELQFSVADETKAVLVLQEDMPSDAAHPREVRIPLLLAPSH